MTDSKLSLVVGYLPIDHLPSELFLAHMPNRIAFLLNSFVPGSADWVFDDAAFVGILESIELKMKSDRAVIEMDDGTIESSLRSLANHYKSISESDREPPRSIRFFCNDTPACGGIVKRWVDVGGPEPYHDTYTLEIYFSADVNESVVKSICELLQNRNIRVEKCIWGWPRPTHSAPEL